MLICCLLLMQGFFNKLTGRPTIEVINAAINYFYEKRGEGVENPDQIRFIHQFLLSMKSMGSNILLQSNLRMQPILFISDIILYNVPASEDAPLDPVVTVFIKRNQSWKMGFTTRWIVDSNQSITSFQQTLVIPVS